MTGAGPGYALGRFVAAFVGTGLLHSSILLGITWLIARRLYGRPRLEELLWRSAVVGCVVTTALATWGPIPSFKESYRIVIPVDGNRAAPLSAAPGAPRGSDSPARSRAADATASAWSTAPIGTTTPGGTSAPDAIARGFEAGSSGAGSGFGSETRDDGWWLLLIGYAWGIGVLLLFAREAGGWLRVRGALGGRSMVRGEQFRILERLRHAAGVVGPVRLSVSPRLPGPVTLPGREICVPPRFFRDLDPDEQQSVMAHELAHIVRRDPAWAVWIRIVRILLFVQILTWIADRRLASLAEINSDDWAADRSGARPLASSLSVIAGWCVPRPSGPRMRTTGLAGEARNLPGRVRRLLDDSRPRDPQLGSGVTVAAAIGVLAAGVALPSLALEARVAVPTDPAVVVGAQVPEATLDPASVQADSSDSAGAYPVRSSAASLEDRLRDAASTAVGLGRDEVTVRYAIPTSEETAPTSSADLTIWVRAVAPPAPEAEPVNVRGVSVDSIATLGAGGLVLDLGLVHPDSSARWMRDRVASLARSGTEPELQRQLVDAIGRHPSDVAEAYLVRLAWIHPNPALRRLAVRLLAGHPSDRAFRELSLIVQRHPEPSVVGEAIEALAELEPRRASSVVEEGPLR